MIIFRYLFVLVLCLCEVSSLHAEESAISSPSPDIAQDRLIAEPSIEPSPEVVPSLLPTNVEPEEQNKQVVAVKSRGQYLVEIAQCGSCHGASVRDPKSPLTGGFKIKDEFGSVIVPNLTPSNNTGIGAWSKDDIMSAIRSSIGRENKKLSISSHEGYRWMSDEDANEIVKYLKSLKAIDTLELDHRNLSGLATKSWGIIDKHAELKGYVPAPVRSTSGYYGMYLVQNVMQCSRCHSPKYRALDEIGYLAGGRLDWYSLSGEEIEIPNIRYNEEGIAEWSEKDIENFILTGTKKDGKKVSEECPQSYFSKLKESDRKSVVNFLKSIK